MPNDGIKIQIDTAADTSGAKQATAALDKVQGSAGAVAAGQDKVAASSGKAAKGTINIGRSALEASRAFEDLQYGIGGVLNNIPGLVMALGGGAGIAGAASIAAVAIAQVVQRMGAAKEEAEDTLDELGDRMEQVVNDMADQAREELEYELALDKIRRQHSDSAGDARREAADQSAKISERLAAAQVKLAGLLGDTLAEQKEITDQVKLEADNRFRILAAKKAEARGKAAATAEEASEALNDAVAKRQLASEWVAKEALQQERLNGLLREKIELHKKIEAYTEQLDRRIGGQEKGSIVKIRDIILADRERLGHIPEMVEKTSERIKALGGELKAMDKDATLAEAEAQSLAQSADQAREAAKIAIDAAQDSFAAEETVRQVDELGAAAKKQSKVIEGLVAGLGTAGLSGIQEQAIATLKQVTLDHEIQADETTRVSASLAALSDRMTIEQTRTAVSITESMKALNDAYLASLRKLDDAVRDALARIRALEIRR